MLRVGLAGKFNWWRKWAISGFHDNSKQSYITSLAVRHFNFLQRGEGGRGKRYLIFDTTVKLIHWPAIHLSLEEVAVRAGHKVLVEGNFDSVLIVGDPWQIGGPTAQALPNLLLKYCLIVFPKS
jgi:hypothetical protein